MLRNLRRNNASPRISLAGERLGDQIGVEKSEIIVERKRDKLNLNAYGNLKINHTLVDWGPDRLSLIGRRLPHLLRELLLALVSRRRARNFGLQVNWFEV